MRINIKYLFTTSEFVINLLMLRFIDKVMTTEVVFIFLDSENEYKLVEKDNVYSNLVPEKRFPMESYIGRKQSISNDINVSKKIKLQYKKFIVSNIEKYPLNFLRITETIYHGLKTITLSLNNSSYSEFLQFDNFLKTYYIPKKIFSVESFISILYFLNYLKVESNNDLKKLVCSLLNNLLNVCSEHETCFDESVCKFKISNVFSFSIFSFILQEFEIIYLYDNELFPSLFYETGDFLLPNRMKFFFGNQKKRLLTMNQYIIENMIKTADKFSQLKFTQNLLLKIFQPQLIYLKNADEMNFDLLDSILLLMSPHVETIIFYHVIITKSLLEFININNIFRKIKNLYFFDYQCIKNVKIIAIDLSNIENIIFSDVFIDNEWKKTFQRFSYTFVEHQYGLIDDTLFGNIKINKDIGGEKNEDPSKFFIIKNINPKETKFFKSINSKVKIYRFFIYISNLWNIYGLLAEDINLYELNIEFLNVIFEKFYVKNEYLYGNIKILNFTKSKIYYAELLKIISVLALKKIIINECEIVKAEQTIKLDQKNFSVTTLKINNTKISNSTKIYDFIHLLENLENLEFCDNSAIISTENISISFLRNEKNLSVFIFSNIFLTFKDIKEMSYFFGSKSISLRKISQIYFFKILFVNKELEQLESLSLTNCVFDADDKECFCFKNIDEIELHQCNLYNLEFHELFSKNRKYSINSIILENCRITINDINFLKTINNLAYICFENCQFNINAIFEFQRRYFMYLKLVTCYYSNNFSLPVQYSLHLYEEFNDIM